MIPIYKPYISKYKSSAISAINDEWISNYGINIELATNKMNEILKTKYCIMMNNGTSATHALFVALKFKHPEVHKVYVPNYVFISPWNCTLLEYDKSQLEVMRTDRETLNIDTSEEYIKSLDSNSAVLIVHNLGNIVNVPRLKRIRPDIIFIEDNCEGFFGKYEGLYSGTQSLCSAVSFYANKTITTGEGGAFFTNDLEIYKYIKKYYSHGMSDIRYVHDVRGTNYRMTNIQAGFLYDQLCDIEHILEKKKSIITNYVSLLQPLLQANKVKLLESETGTQPSNWMFIIIIPNVDYSKLENIFNIKNIQIRPLFYDIYKHNHLNSIKKTQDESKDSIINNGCMLPSYPALTFNEQEYIISVLRDFLA
jgi:perosamine synthetase